MTINKEAESRADAPSYFSVFYQISYIRGMELIHYPPFFSVHTTPHFYFYFYNHVRPYTAATHGKETKRV